MRHVLTVAALLLAGACGSDGPTDPNNNNGGPSNGSMTANVDGAAWSAVSISVTNSSGILGIGGANANGRSIAFALVMNGTGAYPIGATSPTNGLYTEGNALWQASSAQGSGTITLTNLTANSAAGTFSFNLEPTQGGATGTKVITQGVFNVTF